MNGPSHHVVSNAVDISPGKGGSGSKPHGSRVHPVDELQRIARDNGLDLADAEFAALMDARDPIAHLREDFHYPKMGEVLNVDLSLVDAKEDCVYLCGNSLGLCPKKTKEYMDIELDKWATKAVQGHQCGALPWAWCGELLEEDMAKIVGCKREEIAIMNGLTVNLHIMMTSFYRPTKGRYKILFESKAFPSDHYAFESHCKLHGYDPAEALILAEPRPDEYTLRTEDILSILEKEGDTIAVVCFSGVQYYTGQLMDIPTITRAAKAKGCTVGWDMAHAAGNVPLHLHDWDIDFACWCSYKYLCSGAGGLAGTFVHEKYRDVELPQLMGWWGHELSSRFVMDNKMKLYSSARRFRLSNTPGFLCPPLKASLEIFNKTSMSELREKSLLLTGYLEHLIKKSYARPEGQKAEDDGDAIYVDIFTPSDPQQRGAQLSLAFNISIDPMFQELEKRGVICDKRLPRVIRISPSPIFCSFKDVHRFIQYLSDALVAAKSSLAHLTIKDV